MRPHVDIHAHACITSHRFDVCLALFYTRAIAIHAGMHTEYAYSVC